MQPGDLQIGLVHTAPAHRKKGIALSMLQAVIAAGGSPRAHWWLTELDNVASRRLAESAGFSLVGEAVRQKKLGLPVFTLAAGR
jgi:RimJ/RimL family protein N-acetyltransferase